MVHGPCGAFGVTAFGGLAVYQGSPRCGLFPRDQLPLRPVEFCKLTTLCPNGPHEPLGHLRTKGLLIVRFVVDREGPLSVQADETYVRPLEPLAVSEGRAHAGCVQDQVNHASERAISKRLDKAPAPIRQLHLKRNAGSGGYCARIRRHHSGDEVRYSEKTFHLSGLEQ